ncbi:hypothetical protein G3A43_33535 [Paraburkholderia aspalathi]|uniref:hypothetical protein n=1 Tax=Paraburkholderia nemoris TaxID=2793076 RepID=UPI00190A80EE|nr:MULTISPECIES: hypothetical protein [Paraburkholderia]MBK3785145.1 hypothetical protein [Paraburkholderia aspalathi]
MADKTVDIADWLGVLNVLTRPAALDKGLNFKRLLKIARQRFDMRSISLDRAPF